jgi:hypothetical protein
MRKGYRSVCYMKCEEYSIGKLVKKGKLKFEKETADLYVLINFSKVDTSVQ